MTTVQAPPTGSLRIMTDEGDISFSWNKDIPEEVAIARAAWDKARSEEGGRMLGYRVEGEEGTRGEVVREFDPTAERLILSPQLAGG